MMGLVSALQLACLLSVYERTERLPVWPRVKS